MKLTYPSIASNSANVCLAMRKLDPAFHPLLPTIEDEAQPPLLVQGFPLTAHCESCSRKARNVDLLVEDRRIERVCGRRLAPYICAGLGFEMKARGGR